MKKIISILLTLFLCLTLFPVGVLAEDDYTEVSSVSNIVTNTNGKFKLTNDLTLSSFINFGSNVNIEIDLNGHTITGPSGGRLFRLAGVDLTISDSSEEKTGKLIPVGSVNAAAVAGFYGGVESHLTINGGTIDGSQLTGLSALGGAFRMESVNGVLTINDGTFKNFTSTNSGAIVSASGQNCQITINGGTFTNNKAKDGGVIYLENGSHSTLTINGGTFTSNSNTGTGGGVAYIHQNNDFYLNGGTFTGNSGTRAGAFLIQNSTVNFYIGGSPKVYGNSASTFGKDIFLANYNGGTCAQFKPSTIALENTAILYFTTNNEANDVVLGSLLNTNDVSSCFYDSRGTYGYHQEGNQILFGHKHDGLYYRAWTSTNSLPTASDNYFLVNDVNLTDNQVTAQGANIRLCLNGKTIKQTTAGKNIYRFWGNNTSITIDDCNENPGLLTGVSGSAYPFYMALGDVSHDCYLTINNGRISGNRGTGNGGAIRADKGIAHVTINGGEISDNTSNGGILQVINNASSEVIMNGGKIINNTSNGGNYGFAIEADNKASIKLLGGEISNNICTVENLRGVVKTNGTLTLGGDVVIQNNTANGKTINVSNYTGSRVVDSTNPLTEDAKIGFTSYAAPSYNNDKLIVDGDYTNVFFADDDTYEVAYKNEKTYLIFNKTAKVTYKNGTDVYAEDVLVIGAKTTAPATDPTKEGFVFKEWQKDGVAFDFDSAISEDITLDAYFTLNEYSVTFNTNGGTINTGLIDSYVFGTAVSLPTDVTKDHYAFAGWYDNEALSGDPITEISASTSGNKKYYAKWNANTYTITFDANGGSVDQESKEVTYNEAYGTLPIASKDNKSFSGWKLSTDLEGEFIIDTTIVNLSGDATLVAIYDIITYDVIYKDVNNEDFSGTHGAGVVNIYAVDSEYTLDTPSKIGYEFLGYFLNSDGSGSAISSLLPDSYSDTITLYAKWQIVDYTITYSVDGGTINESVVDTYRYGNNITLPTDVTKDEFEFVGWYDNEELSGEAIEEITASDYGNKTFYAKWKTNHIHNVNDGIPTDVEWIAWTSNDSLPSTTSIPDRTYYNNYYFLTQDVYLTQRQVIDRTVVIDLNGHSIYKADDATFTGAMISVSGKWANPAIITNCKATFDEDGFLTSTAGFYNSNATGTEGAVISASGSSGQYPNVKLYGLRFEGNSNIRTANDEWMPGAIFWRSQNTLTIDSCAFVNNVSGSATNDDSTYGSGGAITIKEAGTVNISNTLFDGNKAGIRGSAILLPSGVNATLNISNSRFTNNKVVASNANNGGVISIQAGTTTIKDTEFNGNINNGNNASVIYLTGNANLTLDGVEIKGNKSASQYTTYKAAIVVVDNPTLTITGKTIITGNTNSANKEANIFLRKTSDTKQPKINVTSLASDALMGVDALATIDASSAYAFADDVDASANFVADNANYEIYYYNGNTVLGIKPTITLSASEVSVDREENITVTANVSPDYAANSLIWESDNEEVTTVDSEGKITGVAVGSTTIKATVKGITKEVNVTVTNGKLVKFETNGGSAVSEQYVLKNHKVIKPADPSKDNYTFVAWYLNGEEFDFDTLISEPITLIAKWKANDSGVSGVDVIENVVDGVEVEDGINKLANNASDILDEIKVDGNSSYLVVSASQANKINDATNLQTSIEIDVSGSALSADEELAAKDYIEAYLKDVYDINILLTVKDADTNEKIIDEQKVYSLPNSILITLKSNLINSDAKVVKVFAVHKDVNNNLSVEEVTVDTVDKTNGTVSFYADKFSHYIVAAGNKVTVKFNTNGGSTIDSVKVDYNTLLTKPTNPTKDGAGFAGWFVDEELTTPFDFETPVLEDLTLYANWHEHSGMADGQDNVEWIPWTRNDALPCSSVMAHNDYYNKHYYLTEDVYLSSKQSFFRAVTICLNGHSIYLDENSSYNDTLIEINGKWTDPVIFTNCKATFDASGKLTSTAGIKNANSSSTNGGVVYVRDGVIKFYGINFEGNKNANENTTNWQAGVIFNRGGDVSIYNCAFVNNQAGNIDSGLANSGAGGAITLKGSAPGVLANEGKPTLYVENTIFKDNKAVYRGGAISSDVESTITIKDCDFIENKTIGTSSIGGGALYLNGGSKSTIVGSTFKGNSNEGMRGSAITIESATTEVDFKDCSFIDNTNKTDAKRAAIVIQNANTVSIGGKMYFENNMNGTVNSNILLRADGFKLTVNQLSEGSNVTLTTDVDYVGEVYTDEFGDRARKEITDPDYFLQKGEDDYSSWDSKWLTYEYNDFKITYVDDNDKFEFDIDRSHMHTACGDTNCNHENHDHEVYAYQPWTSSNSLPKKPGNYYLTRNVTLSDGVDISDKADIKICLNGYTIKQTKDTMWCYRLSKDSTLTISDCKATGDNPENYSAGKITGCKAGAIVLRDDVIRDKAKRGTQFNLYDGILQSNHNVKSGGQVQQYGHSVFNMYGGMIKGGYTYYSGGAVSCENDSVANIYDGYLVSNKAKYNGGAIYGKGGNINIYGGILKENVTSYEDTKNNSLGGAVYVCASSNLKIAGGLITQNNAHKGGGVFTLRSDVKISGGSISNNKSRENGGGIYIATKCTFDVTGGSITNNQGIIGGGLGFYDASGTIRNVNISNNKAENRAGGIYATRGSDIKMYNCTVANNTGKMYAGGLYIERNSKITMNNSTFRNNEAESSGGLMASNANVDVTVNNCKFIGNKATNGDGGAASAMNHAVLTINSGEFRNNEAKNSGGAIFIRKAYLVIEDILVEENKAVTQGGGLDIEGIDINITKPVLVMNGGVVRNNTAPRGGGIYITRGHALFNGGTVEENTASYEGGGVYSRNVGYIEANNLTIQNNTAAQTGGGLYLARGTRSFLDNLTIKGNSAKTAAGMYLNDDCQMTNMTITENKASDGVGGLLFEKADYDGESYNSSIIKIGGNMYVYGNEGKISDVLISNGTYIGVIYEGLGKDTKMKINTEGNHIAKSLVGAYNYEEIGDEYLVTYGTEYNLPPYDEEVSPNENNTNYGLIAGVGGGVVALGTIIFLIAKKKKKED